MTMEHGLPMPDRIGCEASEVPLRTLKPGDDFSLELGEGLTRRAVLLRVDVGSASVFVLDRGKTNDIKLADGQVVASVSSPIGLQHWSVNTPVVPLGTRRDTQEFLSSGVKSQFAGGETDMSKKEKKIKAPKVEKKPSLFQALRSKFIGEFAKKVENKEATTHLAVVSQVLLKKEAPMTLDEVVAAVKDTGRYGPHGKTIAAAKLLTYVRADLNALVKDGYVKVSEQA